VTSKDIGNTAESKAEKYLFSSGYKILNRNWRNRWCEIDIVASKYNCIFFVEVKYRSNEQYGTGVDSITHKKLRQMEYAAEHWISSNSWDGDYRLLVISVSPKGIELFEL